MRVNQTKSRLLRGELAAGVFVMANDPHVTGAVGAAGFDFVHYDMEHTTLDLPRLELLVRAADSAGVTPMVRVAGGSKRDILTALEAGAQGIMVPRVESAEAAAEVVRVTRYFPEGERGMFTMGYRSDYGSIPPAEYYAGCNREVLIAVQVESARGVDQAAAIAAVPGVDSLFIGPGDLSQSLGIPGQWQDERLAAAMDETIRASLEAGKIAGGMPMGIEMAARWAEIGLRYMGWALDLGLLRAALDREAALLRERLGWQAEF